jgi:hypothetical protein
MANEVAKKPWYLSKTIWVNTILVGLSVVWPGASEYMSPEVVAGVFALANLALRIFFTDSAIQIS